MKNGIGQSAFVTGAATGIGEALVVRLQREGWQVFAGHRRSPPQQARWFGMPNVIAVPCDVTDPEQVVAAASTVEAHTDGKLDLLINNAGYAPHEGAIEAANMTEYRRAFEVNFWGPLQMVQAMTPLLRGSRGRIINNTSSSVYITIPMYSAYPTSKAALKIFTQHLRMELAPFGIGVTSLEPGSLETPMTETGAEAEERQWASIPEPLRDQYRQHFLAFFTVVGNNATFAQPDALADAVWKRIISARRLRPSYLIGPPQVAVLPWLHRLLPAQQVQNIWRRMFSTKSVRKHDAPAGAIASQNTTPRWTSRRGSREEINMTIAHLSAWLMVAVGGLFSGGIFFVAVERLNLWRRMPVDQYVVDFRRSVYRADPLMPIMGMISALGAVVFAVNSAGRPATLAWIGTALIGVIMVSSIVIAEPINSRFRRLPEGQRPEGAEQLRIRWRRFHLARTGVALLSLACLAAATV